MLNINLEQFRKFIFLVRFWLSSTTFGCLSIFEFMFSAIYVCLRVSINTQSWTCVRIAISLVSKVKLSNPSKLESLSSESYCRFLSAISRPYKGCKLFYRVPFLSFIVLCLLPHKEPHVSGSRPLRVLKTFEVTS